MMNETTTSTTLKLLLSVLLLIVSTMLIYQQTTTHAFVWDAIHYLRNEHITRLNLENLSWMLRSLSDSNWHPLTWLSWAIDYRVYGGLNPWGYHFSNNIIHSLNSALVFMVALVTLGLNESTSTSYPVNTDNKSLAAAFLAALMFAAHPQHVESVAWVAERKDLLCQLFMLLAMLAYVKYVTCPKTQKTGWYLGVVLLYLLAVLSKPMAVTFPAVLLLIDIYPLRRTGIIKPILRTVEQKSPGWLITEKIPFFLLSALLIVLTLMAQQTALSNIPFDWRVLNAFNSIVLYLVGFIYPINLSPHYPYAVTAAQEITWKTFVPIVMFFAITWLVVKAWSRHRPAWLVAWLFYLITLSPVVGLVQVGGQGAADRYTYFTTLPIYLLIAAGLLAMLRKNGMLPKIPVFAVILPFLVFLIVTTQQQIRIWQNQFTLWTHAAKAYPDDVMAHNNLGIIYMNRGDYENAAVQFEISNQLPWKPTTTLAWQALTYLHLGRYKEALPFLVQLGVTSDAKPELGADTNCIQYDIGWIYAHENSPQDAQELFRRVDPESSSGANARLWLDWLQSAEARNGEPTGSDLPDFCPALIPSRIVNKQIYRVDG